MTIPFPPPTQTHTVGIAFMTAGFASVQRKTPSENKKMGSMTRRLWKILLHAMSNEHAPAKSVTYQK